jgi:hypothetical protein
MSDIPGEIAKNLPAIVAATTGAVAGASSEFVKKILGHAADDVWEWGRNKVRAYRAPNVNKVLEDAGKMLEDEGIEPQPVPPKILIPLLEGASLEDDEWMQKRWASLLANAASNNSEGNRGLIAVLQQMGNEEARLLTWMFEHTTQALPMGEVVNAQFDSFGSGVTEQVLRGVYGGIVQRKEHGTGLLFPDYLDFRTCMDSLQSNFLVRYEHAVLSGGISSFRLTGRGYKFSQAVSPPKPKS